MESSFREHHDKCLQDWSKAIESGDVGGLAHYPASNYQGFFGYKDISNITATSRDEAVHGLEQLLSYVVGSKHVAQHRIIKVRTDSEVVVSYERIISKDSSMKMTFLVLQAWRLENDEWKLVREFAENI